MTTWYRNKGDKSFCSENFVYTGNSHAYGVISRWNMDMNIIKSLILKLDLWNEPHHAKTNKIICAPAKTQISLGIRPVWSESVLSAWRKLGSLATHWVHSEDSDQSRRMPRLILVFAGLTDHIVGFVMRRLKLLCKVFSGLNLKMAALTLALLQYLPVIILILVIRKVVKLFIQRWRLQRAFKDFPGPKPSFFYGNTQQVRKYHKFLKIFRYKKKLL